MINHLQLFLLGSSVVLSLVNFIFTFVFGFLHFGVQFTLFWHYSFCLVFRISVCC